MFGFGREPRRRESDVSERREKIETIRNFDVMISAASHVTRQCSMQLMRRQSESNELFRSEKAEKETARRQISTKPKSSSVRYLRGFSEHDTTHNEHGSQTVVPGKHDSPTSRLASE